MTCYMFTADTLSTLHHRQKWFLVACVCIYLISNLICLVLAMPRVYSPLGLVFKCLDASFCLGSDILTLAPTLFNLDAEFISPIAMLEKKYRESKTH